MLRSLRIYYGDRDRRAATQGDGVTGLRGEAAIVGIAELPAATIAIGKRAFYKQIEMSWTGAYAYVAEVMVDNMLHAESAEGIEAFLGKRAPIWDED